MMKMANPLILLNTGQQATNRTPLDKLLKL